MLHIEITSLKVVWIFTPKLLLRRRRRMKTTKPFIKEVAVAEILLSPLTYSHLPVLTAPLAYVLCIFIYLGMVCDTCNSCTYGKQVHKGKRSKDN